MNAETKEDRIARLTEYYIKQVDEHGPRLVIALLVRIIDSERHGYHAQHPVQHPVITEAEKQAIMEATK